MKILDRLVPKDTEHTIKAPWDEHELKAPTPRVETPVSGVVANIGAKTTELAQTQQADVAQVAHQQEQHIEEVDAAKAHVEPKV